MFSLSPCCFLSLLVALSLLVTLRVHRLAKYEGWLARCWKIISAIAKWSAVWTLISLLFSASFPVFVFPEEGCRRPRRGTNTGLTFVGLQGSGSLRPEAPQVAEVCLFPACVPMGVTGWLIIEHGHTVRFVNGTVRMCFAGGVDANVHTCFSVGGAGMNGVIDRLFYNAGCIEDSRVILPAPWVRRAWSSLSLSVLCVSLLLTVSSPLRCFRSGPGVCRRPGRGMNTGLIILA